LATSKVNWGPTGEAVYNRTYSRHKDDGKFETWKDTVDRVVKGNLSLVYGDTSTWSKEVWQEAALLERYMDEFKIIPAGRQLWATGVPGRQYLFNCHVSGWGEKFSDHFAFTFMRLVEGGGVGANYSTKLFKHYGVPRHPVEISTICSSKHQDYDKLGEYAGLACTMDPYVVEDTREGWSRALTRLIDIPMSDQYDGPMVLEFDLSKIRPEGSPLVSSGGTAAGPLPLARMLHDVSEVLNRAHEQGHFTPVDIMEIDHYISVGAVAGGKRRSARMSVCHWNDPHIMDFINAKKDGKLHWTTNVSVEIDNEFIRQLQSGEETWAECVHAAVCKAVLSNGEPGYWNSELAQQGEPGVILSTNPCGEIPLEAWEACNLGHVNLDAFVDYDNASGVDFGGLQEAHRLMTRFLIRSTFADINDHRQREIQDKNRRIGVGHFGVQGYLAKRGIRYSDAARSKAGNGMMSFAGQLRYLSHLVREEARKYAFQLRIPEPVKVTTVAPTGTIAKMPGVTEGIHPVYAKWYERRVRFSKRDEREFEQVMEYMNQGFTIEDDIYDPSGMTAVVVFPTEDILVKQVRDIVAKYGDDFDLDFDESVVESAEDLPLEDMLEMQALYQEHWADNAVSYTCNIAEGRYSPEELQEILAKYLPRLKGTTIMVDASREQAPYRRITRREYEAAEAKRVEDSTDEACSSGACPTR
jgi:adenosylcobalamin-dependent ribonucleoside-triphosphate reductase